MKKFKPIVITPNFYQLGIPSFPVYLSLGEDAMLIEGGTGGTCDIIIRQIYELGIDPKRIKYLALTHTHADHVGAVPRLKALWPHLLVIAGEKAPKLLANEKVIQQFISLDQAISEIMYQKGEIEKIPQTLPAYIFPVDRTVTEGDVVNLGKGISWTMYTVPGHSPCHIAWHEKKEKILAIGDALGFYLSKGDTFWPNYFSSLVEYCNSIRKLDYIPAQLIALGHSGVRKEGIKSFLQKALDITKSYHLEIMAGIAEGKKAEDMAKEKTKWILSISDHMPFKITESMCRLLIKRSQMEAEHPELSFLLL